MSQKKRLSVIIPCYNEKETLKICVEKVKGIEDEKLELEIIIVDDCSNDGSGIIADKLALQNSKMIRVIHHEENRGKGASVRSAVSVASGDFIAIQDADLEYDPKDLKRLVYPLMTNTADVVIGSRFLTCGPHRVLYFWHSVGNRFLTFLSNVLTDLNLTDMESCYKIFKSDLIKEIEIKEDRFGFEPEIVAKMAKSSARIYEMGISYYGRTYTEGKKIGIIDGWRALYCIIKYNLIQKYSLFT